MGNPAEKTFIELLQPSLEKIVEKSFSEHKGRITNRLIKERINIVIQLTKLLRFEYGWSMQRIVDRLPTYLQCVLNNEPFDPGKESSLWIPPRNQNI